MFILNYFSISGICIAIVNLSLAVLITVSGKTNLHKVWAYVNYAIFIFGLGIIICGSTTSYKLAHLGWKIFTVGLFYIATLYYHVIFLFCNLKSRRFLIFSYIQATIFALLTIFTNSVFDLYFPSNFHFFYLKANFPFTLALFIWSIIIGKSFYELYKYIRSSSGISNIQARYLFLAMLFGFGGGMNTGPAAWGFQIYPYGQIFVCVYGVVATYAILRYRIMDIRLAVSNTIIFIGVYAFVLGIPFLIGLRKYGIGSWLIPTTAATVFATLGPFIYLFIQKRAEARILAEQKRAQTTLRLFAAGMMKIRDLERLNESIIHVIQQNLTPAHTVIFLRSSENGYVVRAKSNYSQEIPLPEGSPLIQILIKRKYPIIDEEERINAGDSKNWSKESSDLISEMQRLSASIIIPVLSGEDLLGIILLGRRESKNLFSSEMIETLYSFSVQFALALENIKSIAERERLLNENFEIRRLESLGLVVNSVSHQFNNRFHAQEALLFNPMDIYSEGKFKQLKGEEQVKELIALVDDFADACGRVNKMAQDGGEVTRTILNFSKGSTEFGDVKFDQAVDESLNFVKLKYQKFDYEVVKDYPKDLIIWGTTVGIKEIIQTAVDNSCYFMLKKLERGGEYKPRITINGKLNDKVFHLEIEDNGIGIKKENLRKVMEPMYSTKGHADGTGMGTYTMRHIVMKHKGTIAYESEFDLWTRVKMVLPLGVIAKSKFVGLGPDGAILLSALIKKEILDDISSDQVRLKSNLDQKEEMVRRIIKEAGEDETKADRIWAILETGLATGEQKGV